MELIILIIIFLIIVLFVHKNKEEVIDSFSVSEFLDKDQEHKSSMVPNEFPREDKSIIKHINDFFNTNSGNSDGDDDGGE